MDLNTLAFLNDAQSSLSFAIQQATNIEAEIYKIKYPSFDYASLMPVITEGDEWASSTTFFSQDIGGKAEWISGTSNDMPFADVNRAMHEHGFHMAGIGYEWNIEEIGKARRLGLNLTDDKADSARRVAEQGLWNIAMTGKLDGVNSEKGWTGLINNATVTAGDVPADGTGAVTWWADKTPDQILRDFNATLTGIHTDSKTVEMADTVLLPSQVVNTIGTRRLGDGSDTTILNFLRENNVYTMETRQPLTIRSLRILDTADPGGDGRMVAYRNSRDVLRFHLPMPHKFLPVREWKALGFMVPGIMRTGGLEIRLPKAIRYADGIYNAP